MRFISSPRVFLSRFYCGCRLAASCSRRQRCSLFATACICFLVGIQSEAQVVIKSVKIDFQQNVSVDDDVQVRVYLNSDVWLSKPKQDFKNVFVRHGGGWPQASESSLTLTPQQVQTTGNPSTTMLVGGSRVEVLALDGWMGSYRKVPWKCTVTYTHDGVDHVIVHEYQDIVGGLTAPTDFIASNPGGASIDGLTREEKEAYEIATAHFEDYHTMGYVVSARGAGA